MTTQADGSNTLEIWRINCLTTKNVHTDFKAESDFTGKSYALILREWRNKYQSAIIDVTNRIINNEWSNSIALHYTIEDLKTMKRILTRIEKLILLEDQPTSEITDSMIATAKNYPVEKLIEFDSRGKALAWCHDDKRPSLAWWKKGNKATCFPCNKRFDPIDILTERDGLTFTEAVRRLQ